MSLGQYNKTRLKELITEKALKFGEFKLASGKTASYYLDCRNLTLDGEGANQIALGMIEVMQSFGLPKFVGGMAIGADPITAAIITCGFQQGLDVCGFMVRKEPKAHGMGQTVEGPIEKGAEAVIVEDVVTTGGSSILAIERAREAGLIVEHCITIVDRLAGGADKMAGIGVTLHSLFTTEDLGVTQ
ncbi:MAG: orotate phosphoribosyltransferase [Pirellulaceae bacterium]